MEPSLLSNAGQYPSEEIILSHIGNSHVQWKALFGHIHDAHPDFSEEWRYYRDGKSWLLKVTCKKKTIFWLSIIKDAFRTTFYFTDKANDELLSSNLSEDLKKQFLSGKRHGKIQGVTIVHAKNKDVEDAKILIAIKLRMK
jgi:hypothetical protein